MKKFDIDFDKCYEKIIFLYIFSLFIFNNITAIKTNYVSLVLFIICFFMTAYKCLKRKEIKIDNNFIIYIIFLVFGFISIFYASNKNFVLHKVIQMLINSSIILIFINFIDSSKKINFVLKSFLISGLMVAVLIIVTTDYSQVTRLNRPGSQIGNVNSLAIMMTLSLTTLMILKDKFAKKKYYYGMEILLLFAILLTGSRKGILALLILYFMVFIVKNWNNKKVMFRNLAISFCALIIILLIIYFNPYLHEVVWLRLNNFLQFILGKNSGEFSLNARDNMIKFGMDLFKRKPLFGYGLDNYRYFYNNAFGYDYYAHNNYVELLVDLGIVGTIAYYTLIILPIIKLIKKNIFKKNDTFIYFSMLLISLFLDFAWVSYISRVWIIYISIVYAYLIIDRSKIDDNIKVSVIMSTYKTDKKILTAAIESILNQSYKNIEFIIVCDGDLENMNIIKSYNDKRIVVLNNEKNMGLPYSLNQAIKKANGKYIIRMDSDDIALKERIAIQVEYMEKNPEIAISGMFAKNIGTRSGFSLNPIYKACDLKIQLFYKCSLIHPTVIMRRQILIDNNIFYNEKFKYAQDYELWSRCNKEFNISIIPKVGLLLRIHDKQISVQKKEEQNGYYLKTLKKNMNYLNIDNNLTYVFLVLNGKRKLAKHEINDFYNCLNLIEKKLKNKYKNVDLVINNTLFNLYLKHDLFDFKYSKTDIMILRKRIFNFTNCYLSLKRVYLVVKCKLSLYIKYY